MKGISLIGIEIAIIVIVVILITTFLMFYKVRVRNFFVDVSQYFQFVKVPEVFYSMKIKDFEWKETYYSNQPVKSYCSRCSDIGNGLKECICKKDVPLIYVIQLGNVKVFDEFSNSINSKLIVGICSSLKINSEQKIFSKRGFECLKDEIVKSYEFFIPNLSKDFTMVGINFHNSKEMSGIDETSTVPFPGP